MESYFKLTAITIGILGEYYTALDSDWRVVHKNNVQHIMMYAFFAFNGLMELIYHYKVIWVAVLSACGGM